MKGIKPMRLSALQRVVEHEHVPRLIVSVIAGFSLDDPKNLVPEPDLWPAVLGALTMENAVLDEAMAKVRGEVLVNGSCYPPGGAPTAVSFVRVRCGKVDKRLAVIGDRHWRRGVPTEPEPFEVMPVDWSRAFGGEDYDKNPLGRGLGPIEVEGEERRPLPNVEHPDALIVNPGDRPEPAGLGGMDPRWPQRADKAGTYDAKWLEERAFGFAKDIDPTMFNLAAEDQWLDDYFTGEETFVIENMHPSRPRIEGTLPPLRARAFATVREEGVEESVLREITLRLDTLRLFPEQLIGVLIYRGSLDVAEEDASDVAELLVAGEDVSRPRPASHYREAIELRRDPETAGMLSLTEKDLMPPRELGWAAMWPDNPIQQLATPEHHRLHNLQRRQQLEIDQAKERLVASGLDPVDFGWDERPEVPEVDLTDYDSVIDQIKDLKKRQDEEIAQAEEKNEKLQRMARESFAEQGLDYDAEVAKAKKEAAGPPKFDAQEQLDLLRANLAIAREHGQPLEELEELANDPEYEATLVDAERRLLEVYRKGAHLRPGYEPLTRAESEIQRAEIGVAHHNEIKLEDLDYSGVDLSEMDLKGADLSGGLLEAVDLTETDLTGGDLSGTVLAHARLKGTKLGGCKLVGANLGAATLDGVDLSGSDLSDLVLQRTTIRNTSFAGCRLDRCNLLEAELQGGVSFEDARGEQLMFYKLNLRGARFARAFLQKTVFIECDLREADLSESDFTRSVFVTCPMDGAQLEGATFEGVQLVQDTTLSAASFRRVRASAAMLRGLDLRAAQFEGAVLDGADLSSAKLEQASFLGARARNALFIRSDLRRAQMHEADLLGAIMMKAKLQATDLSGANLFQADLSLIRVDGETKLDGANLGRARVHPKARD